MLSEIVRFEWRYHVGQATFVAAAILFFLLGFALTASGFGPDNLPVNSPYLVMESLGFLSLLSLFAAAAFVANAIIRDSEHRMAEIVYCTPVGKLTLLAGRFLGAFLTTLTVAALSAVGMAVASFMPWLDSERAGALNLIAYLWALAVITLPNVLFVTSVLFAVAALTRSAIASYVAAVFVYALYLVGAALTNSPLMAGSTPGAGGGVSAALLDPFGLSTFFEETRYWTVAEKTSHMAGLGGMFVLNRAVWAGLAILIWAVVYRSFSFRLLRRSKRKQQQEIGTEPPARSSPYATALQDRFSTRVWLASFASATRLELRALVRSLPFLLLLVLWTVLAAFEIHAGAVEAEYGSRSYPTTSLVMAALRTPLSLFGTILLIYYTAEVFWREQRYRLAAVVNATPVRSSAIVVAKWIALVTLVSCLVTCGIVAGIGIQISNGYWKLEPGLYASLFYFAGVPLMLFAAASLLVHALSPGKYVGMVATLLLAIVAQRGQAIGLEHHLWRFGTAPPVPYTEMNGFGHNAAPFHWYMLVWAAASGLAILLVARLWRTIGAGVRERVRRVVSGDRPVTSALAAALVAILVVSGGWVLYNTRILNADSTLSAASDWKADYERTYSSIAGLPHPRVDDIEVAVDLFPHERRYRVAGRLGLVNGTRTEITTVYVAVRRDAAPGELSIGDARLAARDARFGMYRFELDRPLGPGARTELRFELSFENSGFADDGQDNTVVENGSLVMGFQCIPTLGYRASYEISDPRERRRRGLAEPREAAPDEAADHGSDLDNADFGRVSFVATVSTSPDQIAVAPGRLEHTWEKDGRRYFRFRSDAPTLNRLAFASARYDVARRRHRDVDVEIYYHVDHGANVSKMLDAATASLDRFAEAFGPYPHGQLKIAEVPAYWEFGAFAMPDTIWFVETRGFLTDTSHAGPVDLITRRIAHEIAHQWWGHQLAPTTGPGASLVVESLAKYSELLVLERMYGRQRVGDLLDLELDRYLAGRAREEHGELSLREVGDQAYLYYAKGAVVMYGIRDLIGEESMNAALRDLLRAHSGSNDASPTSVDLIDALLDAAPSERERALIREWMNEIVLYDLGVTSAVATQRADGRYEIGVQVSAARTRADASGNETPITIDEAIEIGVFAKGQGDDDVPLRIDSHQLRQGQNSLSIVVDRPPSYVTIDPYVTRIDKNRFDNDKPVEMR